MSVSLLSHGLKQARLPCPAQTPRTCSNSCPSSRWCHPTISSSVVPFSSCLLYYQALGSFQSVLPSGRQSTWSFSFSISPSTEYSVLISFRIDWFESPRDSRESSPTPEFKSINFSKLSLFMVQLLHPCMTTGKTIALTIRTFVGKVMPLLFNMLSRFVITFLPRSKHLLISWMQSPSAVIWSPRKY